MALSETEKRYRATKRGHLCRFLSSAKERSIKQNVSFDLTLDYLESITTDECPVFKTPFVWGQSNGKHPYRPSLDKVVPELGYVRGNVVFISLKANTIKQDITEKELYAVADWLHDKRKEVLENVKPKPVAPLPDEDNWEGEMHPQHRTISTTGIGKDSDNADHHSGTVYRQDVNHSPKTSSRDSVGHGDKEVGTSETLESVQDNWELHPTYGWIERKG
jgi:hypothetical protein